MKKIILAIMILVLSSITASAESGWGFFGSYWSPSDGEAEFGPGIRLTYEMVPGMQLDFRASYFDNLMDEDEGPDLEVIPIETGLCLTGPVAGNLNLHGGVGVGYYLMDSDADVDDEIGFFVNAGLEYDVFRNNAAYGGTRASVFAEAMYRSVTADDATINGDADLDGLVLNAGLMVRW